MRRQGQVALRVVQDEDPAWLDQPRAGGSALRTEQAIDEHIVERLARQFTGYVDVSVPLAATLVLGDVPVVQVSDGSVSCQLTDVLEPLRRTLDAHQGCGALCQPECASARSPFQTAIATP